MEKMDYLYQKISRLISVFFYAIYDYLYPNRILLQIKNTLETTMREEKCTVVMFQDCNCGTELLKSIAGSSQLLAIGMRTAIYNIMREIVNDKSFDIYDQYIFTSPLRENFLCIKKTCSHTRDVNRCFNTPLYAKITIMDPQDYI